ncbi:hypothetical protein CK203_116388 [Vitis vinifera]|uniref:XIAP-associated factor 1 n=1 Tax=Vitis vinifera TaxID=29760 RepID=A0A438F859_VITVI|nr:hypothetical protein CK203_116388 [Vitis vinifera]
MEREILAVHKGENCPQRIVTCEFCEFPLPAIDLSEHQEVCGNRTELCHLCRRYVRLRERNGHEAMCNGAPDNSVGVQDNGVGVSDHTVSSSRIFGIDLKSSSTMDLTYNFMLVLHLESARRDARAAEREQGGQRRPPLQGFSQRRLLFTIAITGIAVLLGSLFFQKKTENH